MKSILPILASLLAVLSAAAQTIVLEAGAGALVPNGRQDQSDILNDDSASLVNSFSGKPPAKTETKPAKLSKANVLAREALQLAEKNKPDLAEEKLQQAEAVDGGNPAVLNGWVAVLAGQGKFEPARIYARRAIALDPTAFAPRFNHADLFLMEKRYAEARDEFQKLLADFPQSELLWLKLLLIGLLDRKPDDAKTWLAKFSPDHPSECSLFAKAAVEFSKRNLIGGKQLIQDCFREFGTGQKVQFLYKSFSELHWVEMKDYPGLDAR